MATKSEIFATVNDAGAKAYDESTHINLAGGKAFTRTLEERVVQALMTNTLDNTFYADAKDLAKGIDAVFREILNKDPEFFAKAIVHARNEGCMRLVPIVGLVYLSTCPNKAYFYKVFDRVIQTPHDLSTFVEWCSKSGIRGSTEVTGQGKPKGAKGTGLGTVGKRAITKWLTAGGKYGNGLTEYHAIKYPMTGQFSLANIIKVARPKPTSPEQNALYRYVVKGELGDANLPQVKAFEAMKVAANQPEVVRALIEQGRLPYEAVTGAVKPDTATWTYLMKQMPHFALLRHLNTLERNGVFADESNVDHVVNALTHEETVLKSKVLPFNYYTSWMAYCVEGFTHGLNATGTGYRVVVQHRKGFNQRIADALVACLEISFQNIPELPGNIVVSNDVSGSMSGQVSEKGKTRYCDIAGLFGAVIFKRSPKVSCLPADTSIVNIPLSRHDTILSNARKLGISGGGTDLGVAMQHVNATGTPMDVYLGITDSEEWHTRNNGYGRGSYGFYGEWCKRRNKNAKAFLVNIAPYQDSIAPPGDDSVYCISGWSANVLAYISLTLKGMGTQVDHVRRIRLDAPSGTPTVDVEVEA